MNARDGAVVFAGGGTGGHLYPAIAIAQAMGSPDRIAFIGTADRLEATIVPEAGYRLYTVRSRPLTRKLSFEFLRTLVANARGAWQSAFLLARLKPSLVIATGGYVCFPVVLAARWLRAVRRLHAPIVLLEPNARPGLTNRLLAPLVDEVWGAFREADPRFAGKYVHTGIPVRASLAQLPQREAALARLGLSPERKTLLAMGGSQGARSINDALAGLIAIHALPPGWQLIHVTGEREYDRVRTALGAGAGPAVRPYLNDVADAYAAADLVLARAGASTLGELMAVGLPSILVPYPHAADDHQTRNAEVFAEAGAAILMTDRELAAGQLGDTLERAIVPERLHAMRAAALGLQNGSPIATILARIDALAARKTLG